jgi:adenine-specific DNA-methyltransferase
VAYRKQYEFVKFNPRTKQIENTSAGMQYENIIDDFFSAEGGRDFTEVLEDKNLFAFPKPIKLIQYLINMIDNKDAIILDFFAGSGTTGQAVLEANLEDGGTRQFILCTLDEGDIPEKITVERLKRIMTGKDSLGKANFP